MSFLITGHKAGVEGSFIRTQAHTAADALRFAREWLSRALAVLLSSICRASPTTSTASEWSSARRTRRTLGLSGGDRIASPAARRAFSCGLLPLGHIALIQRSAQSWRSSRGIKSTT